MSIYQKISEIRYNNNDRKTWENISAKDLVDLPKTSKSDLRRLFDCFEDYDHFIEGTVFQSMLIDELFSRNDPKLIAEIFSSMVWFGNVSQRVKNPQSTLYLIAQKICELNCTEVIRILFNKHDKSFEKAFLSFIQAYRPQEKANVLLEYENAKAAKKKSNQKTRERRQRNNDMKQLAKFIKKYPKELQELLSGKKVEELLS